IFHIVCEKMAPPVPSGERDGDRFGSRLLPLYLSNTEERLQHAGLCIKYVFENKGVGQLLVPEKNRKTLDVI
ncbi:hypothetical protein L9F63_015105, partial [Diploptera punctata]